MKLRPTSVRVLSEVFVLKRDKTWQIVYKLHVNYVSVKMVGTLRQAGYLEGSWFISELLLLLLLLFVTVLLLLKPRILNTISELGNIFIQLQKCCHRKYKILN